MTQGILIFAFNSGDVDYVELAIFAAKKAKAQLNKPVSLVTDSKEWLLTKFPNDVTVFDEILESTDTTTQTKRFYDGTNNFQNVVWKNSNRVNCFELSPYDETLVIDSDYIINSTFLQYCWQQPNDFLIYKHYNDLAGWRDTSEFDYVNEYTIPFYWATVFFFRKTELNKSFFVLIEHIKNNWNYFVKLYQLPSARFRNDIAFSIAIHMMNGFMPDNFATPIANKLHYTLDRDLLVQIKNSKMKFLVQKKTTNTEYTALKTESLDVHVMNKRSLIRCIREELSNV
jgi:hypothetical protein